LHYTTIPSTGREPRISLHPIEQLSGPTMADESRDFEIVRRRPRRELKKMRPSPTRREPIQDRESIESAVDSAAGVSI